MLWKLLGGWTNPFQKILVKMGIFPKFRGENKNYLSCHHPDYSWKSLKVTIHDPWFRAASFCLLGWYSMIWKSCQKCNFSIPVPVSFPHSTPQDSIHQEHPDDFTTGEDSTGRFHNGGGNAIRTAFRETRQHTLPETNMAPENGWLEY